MNTTLNTAMNPGTGAVIRFENADRELKREKRKKTFLFGALFLSFFIVSVIIGEVRISTFIEGLPGLFNYIGDILPEIHRETVFSDIGNWYWGIGRWLGLLLDTILIAFLGTFLGTFCAFMICFPASRRRGSTRKKWFAVRPSTASARC